MDLFKFKATLANTRFNQSKGDTELNTFNPRTKSHTFNPSTKEVETGRDMTGQKEEYKLGGDRSSEHSV